MDDSQEYLREKKQFYAQLDALSRDDSDDAVDEGRIASQAAWNKTMKKKVPVESSPPTRTPARTLARSASDSIVGVTEKAPTSVVAQPSAPPSATDPANNPRKQAVRAIDLKRSASDTSRMALPAKTAGKRKRETAAELVPEAHQIFRDLHFYFFPNSDTNPARKKRIAKALQFGAKWEKEWTEAITHVVVDKNMDLNQVLRYLKLDRLPDTVFAVHEDYSAECVAYRARLPEARFAVKGSALPSVLQPNTKGSASKQALQVQPSGTAHAARSETPPRDTGVEINDLSHIAAPVEKEAEILERIPDSLPTASIKSNKELDDAIRQAKLLQYVPIDEDDNDHRPTSSEEIDSADEEQESALKMMNQRKNKVKNMQDKFQCMQKHTGKKSGTANQATIDVLQQMADYYGQTGDEWRIRAYRKAISTLRNHPTKVCTKDEALSLPNIGGRLAEKIEEIATTSRLRRLESAKAEPGDQVLQTFMGVYGAGLVQATRWVDQGYKTLDELLQKADVTENQRIGIEHYEDFNTRIPRAEVERHGNVVRTALQRIDPAFEVIIGGSYRRGSSDSGDIDCIVTRPDTGADHLRNVVLGQLVPLLTKAGFLVASLAITSRDDGSKWHGASCLLGSKVWRRLDLLLVPSDELGAALCYLTGNDIFNRSLRLLASTKGMRLNQRGLYKDVIRGPKRAKLTEGTLVEGRDEKRIFEALGVPWRPPEHRIC